MLNAEEATAASLIPPYRQFMAGDLSIAELKSRIVEGRPGPLVLIGEKNIHEHFRRLRKEFAGSPELCFVHAQLIVCIRRSRQMPKTLPAFFRLWADEPEFLSRHLNSRWLISACDTFADHGTPAERAAAMLLVTLINTVKLAETERLCLADAEAVPEKLSAIAESHRHQTHVELWDGLTAYAPFAGDMPRNMFRRMMAVTGEIPAFAAMTRALIGRAAGADNLLGRLARLNPGFFAAEAIEPAAIPLAPEA
jgi:hypothetical protein